MRGCAGPLLSGMHSAVRVNTPLQNLLTRLTSTIVKTKKKLTLKTLNPNLIKLQYTAREPIVIRAMEIQKELEKGIQKPFKRIISANIDDAHAMGQLPITFFRQVLSCVLNPEHIKSGEFLYDVKARAVELLAGCGGAAGSYTPALGMECVRRHVADFLARRDGYSADWQNICLTQGASAAIKRCLQMFCATLGIKDSGVMIPVPQYPLYSAALAECGLGQVDYYLNEDTNWSIEKYELERAFEEGSKTHAVRALVVINPGNPTGQVLSEENIRGILEFAYKHGLFVLADEVNQENVYAAGSKFTSFKKILMQMGPPYSEVELASFMSISKGYMGECGLRGGWMELVNLDPEVQANLYKAISAMRCPNTIGQCIIDMVARPPLYTEPSYEQWMQEKSGVLNSLRERSKMVVDAFNRMDGFTCNGVQGATFAFPRIELPLKAVVAARAEKQPLDVFYAFKLLEETGICIVPGSRFGQLEGTHHFRTSILPQTELLKEMLDTMEGFHSQFTQQFS